MTVAAIIAAILFTVAAGFNDGGNLLAISASSRTIAPARAFVLICLAAFAGPFVFGTAVAHTIGAGIADYSTIGPSALVAAFAGALATVGVAYAARIPMSLSVALFSSMIGALWAGPGLSAIRWSGVERIAISMGASIVIGSLAGSVAYRALMFVLGRVHRRAGERLMLAQYATAGLLAMGYGANDLEKSAGLLAAVAQSTTFTVPAWTLVVAAAAFAGGLAVGGVRVARTVGGKLFTIRPQHAFAAQAASSLTVIGAALLGGPLSTTDTSASALVGVGAAVNPRAVRWGVVFDILLAWIIAIPAALAAGAVAALILKIV